MQLGQGLVKEIGRHNRNGKRGGRGVNPYPDHIKPPSSLDGGSAFM